MALRGVEFEKLHQIERVNPDTQTLGFTNGKTVKYDLLLYAAPCRGPEVLDKFTPQPK